MTTRTKKKAPPEQLGFELVRDLLSAAEDTFGAHGNRVARAFRLMAIAEEELAKNWPRSTEPRGVFMLLCATKPLTSEMLYRSHAQEMCARVIRICRELSSDPNDWKSFQWNELARLTAAELLGITCQASLRHPLAHHDSIVYETLFRRTFPHADLGIVDEYQHGDVTLKEIEATLKERLAPANPERAEHVAYLRSSLGERP